MKYGFILIYSDKNPLVPVLIVELGEIVELRNKVLQLFETRRPLFSYHSIVIFSFHDINTATIVTVYTCICSYFPK